MEEMYTVERMESGGIDSVELTLGIDWDSPVTSGRHRFSLFVSQEFAKNLHIGTVVVLTLSKKEE